MYEIYFLSKGYFRFSVGIQYLEIIESSITHFTLSSVAEELCISHCLPGCRNSKNSFSLQIESSLLETEYSSYGTACNNMK